jgi:hypothetical protein
MRVCAATIVAMVGCGGHDNNPDACVMTGEASKDLANAELHYPASPTDAIGSLNSMIQHLLNASGSADDPVLRSFVDAETQVAKTARDALRNNETPDFGPLDFGMGLIANRCSEIKTKNIVEP